MNGAGGTEIRNPKSEARRKSESRNPRSCNRSPAARAADSNFGFRASFGFRLSGFGFGPHPTDVRSIARMCSRAFTDGKITGTMPGLP